MRLYHYSIGRYSVLKPLYLQRRFTKAELKKEQDIATLKCLPDIQIKHVSLLMEPLLPTHPQTYGGTHEIWYSGRHLFEHTIDVERIPQPFTYMTPEMPVEYDIWHKVCGRQSYSEASQQELRLYYEERAAEGLRVGSSGSDVETLNAFIANNAVLQSEAIRQVAERHKAGKLREPHYRLYAADIPHIQVFVSNPIPVTSVRLVMLK